MTKAKAEKIRKGIENKIRSATADMEDWADFWGFTVDEYYEFLDMAMEVLEQELNEDYISRAKAIEEVNMLPNTDNGYSDTYDKVYIISVLEKLPSVVSQEKIGRWVKVSGYATPGGDTVWECSECGKGRHVYGIEAPSYQRDVSNQQWVACPNCGAKMKG